MDVIASTTLRRVPLTMFVAQCSHVCTTPPFSEPNAEERARYDAFVEIALAFAAHTPSHPTSRTVLHALVFPSGGTPGALRVTPPAAIGAALVAIGTVLRLTSYSALGPLFTFELSLKPAGKHKLVTTGPYAYVRHPSYAGAIFFAVGITLCLFSPGGWIVEGGWLQSPFIKWVTALWIVTSAVVTGMVVRRAPLEDKVLKEEFGEAWSHWATRVRWRIIPGFW
ncbi:hypothetical protein BV25DRAFT_1310586 [Artomyces pyxidatus]|uniref:Uncharacterized protein n=1 Tax=Artomyces pyxidatus TaxID=48021 RepID=A0ACB8SQQ3_9AGAM|nr:hypothetical protein BV25DRAFT_1310586 [Artomyces pyxidatus]